MKKIISNFLFFLTLSFAAFPSAAAAGTKILPYFSLYGEPKYAPGFTSFDYADPKAPKGGRIVLPAYGSFDNFNPYIFKGIASPETAALTLDTLGFSPADDISTAYPLIAEKFEIPDDGSFIGFILDKRAKFQDGSPVLADDVIFSFNALIEKGSPIYKVYYGDVVRTEKVNDHHIRFHFRPGSQNKELPLILTQISVFSAKDWQGKDFSTPITTPPLGSGPYKVDNFSFGRFTVLKRDKNYWAQNIPSRAGFFNFDEIRYDYYQDTTVTLQALFARNIDMREEYIAKIWVTGYDNDLIKSGKIKKEDIAHNRAANLQSFAFNLRRPQFQDKNVRRAIGLAFDFDWANEKLFYNQYRRIEGYFPNSGLEASGRPQGKERKLLQKYKNLLPTEVFGELPQNPHHGDYLQSRQNLRRAVALLKQAGYDFVDGKMTNLQTGRPLEFEILSNTANGSAFTRVMLPFLHNLQKIGIKAVFRNIETNIFKNRLDKFDYDIAIISYPGSSNPGNELKEIWGSGSAGINGSFNIIGVQNPAVDALIAEIVKAQHKDDYIAAVNALDRVLRHEYYLIPHWYSPYQRVAYWDRFAHKPSKEPIGLQIFTWWEKASEGKK